MKRFFLILGFAGGVVLLILLAVAIAVSTVDPNNFIGPIEARVKAATGRNLAIGGGIELKLGLEPKLVANDVHIGNAPWASAKDMLVAKKVEAQVALLPLLQRRFDLLRLNLVDPVIALETNAKGVGNWEFASSGKDAPGAKDAEQGQGSYAIGDIAITHGTLTYHDGATGAQTNVMIDTLSLKARDASSPVNAEFRGEVDGIAIAVTGSLGPLETLAQHRLPYPVAVQGEVAGRKASVALKVLRDDDGLAGLQDVDVTSGASNVKGSASVKHAGARPMWTVNLTSPSLAMGDFALPVAGASTGTPGGAPSQKKTAATATSAHGPMFADTPLSFEAVRKNNGNGEIAITRLVLEDGRVLERVRVPFSMQDGKLDVTSFQASAFGGTLSGTIAIDARGTVPAIALRIEGHQLDLGPLLAAAGVKREVKGGKTEVSIDVAMRGDSPHKWMSGIGGRARAVVGPATIVNSKIDPSQSFDRLAQAVNPLRQVNANTELKCAVVRLPLANGVATIDRSIGVETNQIDVTASGTLDFRNETLDLSFKPRIREGITIDVSEFASLVHVRGPFAAPTVGIDAAGSAATLARIGAAVSTGGLSLLGETILKSGGAAACDVALGKADSSSSSSANSATRTGAPQPAEDLGKALGKLLGR